MVCPFDSLERQALLEAPDLHERARTLRTLLRIDMHQSPGDPDDDTPDGRHMAS
jgi:Lon protease-like protein